MRTIMVKEHLEKKVFELARGLWDRQNSINHISSHKACFLVKNETNEVF